MNFVVMVIRLQVVDDMLPIGRQYIAGSTLQTLVYLLGVREVYTKLYLIILTFAQVPVYNSARGA